jgi:membrane protease YdiL (CAAX protease family)
MSSAGTQPTIEQLPGDPQLTPSPRTRWIDLGLVLVVSFAEPILIAVYALFNPAYVALPSPRPGLSIVYMLLRYGTAFLALAYVFSRQRRNLRSIGVGFRWSDPLKGFGLMVLAAIVVAILHSAVRSFDHAFGIIPDARQVAADGWKERSVSDFIHDLSAPIFEEVLVRGYFMTEMIELGKPVALAIIASVILQASYHVYYGLGKAVALSGVFIVFAVYFANSRRLMPVLLAHLFWDLTLYFSH